MCSLANFCLLPQVTFKGDGPLGGIQVIAGKAGVLQSHMPAAGHQL